MIESETFLTQIQAKFETEIKVNLPCENINSYSTQKGKLFNLKNPELGCQLFIFNTRHKVFFFFFRFNMYMKYLSQKNFYHNQNLKGSNFKSFVMRENPIY